MHIHRSEVFMGGEKAQLSLADLVKGQFCLLLPSTILGMRGNSAFQFCLLRNSMHGLE